MKRKEHFIATLALVLVGAVAFLWLSPSGIQQAPDATVTRLEGGELRLSELNGRPVLITFWATTCPSCVQEIPDLIELHNELAPKGLAVVAIAMDYDPPAQVRELAERRGLPYIVALDSDGSAARAFGDVKLTPTNILIDPQGRVVYRKLGMFDKEELAKRIRGMTAMLENDRAVG